MFTRWFRIRYYRRNYNNWCRQPASQYGQASLVRANAAWDRMSETDRQFILNTETQ